LLVPYLRSVAEASSHECLEHLLKEIAKPIIRKIVHSSLQRDLASYGNHRSWQTAEDVSNDVLVKLLTRLQILHADPQQHPISNFRGLVAITTYRTLTDLRRETNRQRANLDKKIRRLFGANINLAIWKDHQGSSLCGYASWRLEEGQKMGAERGHPSPVELFSLVEGLKVDTRRRNTAEVALLILDRIHRPVRLSDLIDALSSLEGAVRTTTIHIDETSASTSQLAHLIAVHPDAETNLETRRSLELLLAELQELNPFQRKALLLNMTDSYGYGIEWFVFTGIATEKDLSDLLEVPLEEFRGLLDRLPMTDKQIAQMLGITPMKVANIRKSVRDRLKRRQQAFFRGRNS
jgi:RNA polymerase sigma factor (sigma-70 family)